MKKRYTLYTAQEALKEIGWSIELVTAWFGDCEHQEKYVLFHNSTFGGMRRYVFSNTLKPLVEYATAEETKLENRLYG